MARFGRGFPTKVKFTKPARFVKVASGSSRVTGSGRISPTTSKHVTSSCRISGTMTTTPRGMKVVSRNSSISGTGRIPPSGTHKGRGTEAISGVSRIRVTTSRIVTGSSRVSGVSRLVTSSFKTASGHTKLSHHVAQVVHSTKHVPGTSSVVGRATIRSTTSKHVAWSSLIFGTAIDILGRRVNGDSAIRGDSRVAPVLIKRAHGVTYNAGISFFNTQATKTAQGNAIQDGVFISARNGTHHGTANGDITAQGAIANPIISSHHAFGPTHLSTIRGASYVVITSKSSRFNNSDVSGRGIELPVTTSLHSGRSIIAALIFENSTFGMRHAVGESSTFVTMVIHPVGSIPTPRNLFITFGNPRRRWDIGLPFTDPNVS